MKGRSKRLCLHRIKRDDGSWVEGNEQIAEEALKFFINQFSDSGIDNGFSLLQHISPIVTTEEIV